jgi:hypothetical protein
VPDGPLRLTIASPLHLGQVLEASLDLHDWHSVGTNAPAASPFAFERERAAAGEYYRVRW